MVKKIGICKLTLTEGKFVKSHLIPQSLTRPEINGAIMTQIGEYSRPQRASTSWYDAEIVTRDGEDVLTEFDTTGIIELRKQKLVWGSWDSNELSNDLFEPITDTHGIRLIKNIGHKTIRLFGLSLLWRACVSQRKGFENINIPEDDLETIRKMLLKRESQPAHFYPIQLTQLSTKGLIHNQTPLMNEVMLFEKCEITGADSYKIIRFYFDGLIMHIRMSTDKKIASKSEKLLLGMHEDDFLMPTITYEASFQKENVQTIIEQYGEP